MAHELDFRNGVASMFSVGETPWHNEGVILAEAPSYDEALRLANIDYKVVKQPLRREVKGDDGGSRAELSKLAFVTMREDTQEELGAVGPNYEVLQNVDAFRAMEPLLDAGVLRLETGGVLRNGADSWLLGRFDLEKFGPVVREVFADEVIPFALFTNNHAGRRKATVAETPIRVVCANTLGFAEHEMDRAGKSVKVSHTGDAAQKMVEAAETMFAAIIERYETIAVQYRLLKSVTMTADQMLAVVLNPALPDPRQLRKFNPEAKLAELVVERYETKRDRILDLWVNGKGHTGDHSAWEAYNALVEAVDHDAELFPTRGGTYRTASLMYGNLGKMKEAALHSVVAFARDQQDELDG